MQISREIFEQQQHPRFGTSNPERMRVELWEWMIRGGGNARMPGEITWIFEDGKLQGTQTPYAARQFFRTELDCAGGPCWTFDRMGATQTTLNDGRIVCIGGEHEDFYDPDFCIYNDVVVLGPSAEVEIFGYPKEVFPPTDFHTASLVGNEIVIIGCTGYQNERRYGYTPMYRLDLTDYHIREMTSLDEMPGWISKHAARVAPDGVIVVTGGEVVSKKDEREVYRPNIEEYAVDIASGSWRRLTNRNWPQFAIRMESRRMFNYERWPRPKTLLPEGVEYSLLECDSLLGAKIAVRDVRIAISVKISEIRILVEGDLPPPVVEQLIESMRVHAQSAVGESCWVEEI